MSRRGGGYVRRHFNVESLRRRCETQKVCYDTKADALNAAEVIMELGHVSPGCHITPYPCEQCRYWHVANKRIVYAP